MDSLIQNVSHDLRSPLACIVEMTCALLHPNVNLNRLKLNKFLNMIYFQAKLSMCLVGTILDMYQIKYGVITENMYIFKPKKTINLIKDMFKQQTSVHGVDIIFDEIKLEEIDSYYEQFESKDSLIENDYQLFLKGDKVRFTQVLINLVKNAVKFTKKGTITIDVTYNIKLKRIIVKVIDTGIGISQEDQTKLFKKNSKLNHSQSMNREGIGLGLMICK